MIWKMAERASQSAFVLLADGDERGAVNRAYYAMFYAARASLIAVEPVLGNTKSHSEVLRRFSKFVVMGKGMERRHGRFLKNTFRLRTLADYEFSEIDLSDIDAIVAGSSNFVSAVKAAVPDAAP